MTNKQITDINKLISFVNNIGKLSVGRSTQFKSSFGTRYGKVTCDTVGRRPRLFTVSDSAMIENGSGFTYSTIMKRLVELMVF